MSRTNQEVEKTGSSNPATKFVEFNGETGAFNYYSKADDAKINLPWPVSFLILDQRHTVKGWNKPNKSNIYANEVLDQNTQEMNVRIFKGDNKDICKGLYPEMKEKVKAAGGHYVRSIYVLLHIKESDTWELANIGFKGTVSYEWNNFVESLKTNRYQTMIYVTQKGLDKRVNGNVTFYVPVFKSKLLSKEVAKENVLLTEADKQDMILQDYFAGKVKDDTGSRSTAQPEAKEEKAQEPQASSEQDPFAVDTEEEDDDLPF